MKFCFTVMAILLFIVQNIQNKDKPKFNFTERAVEEQYGWCLTDDEVDQNVNLIYFLGKFSKKDCLKKCKQKSLAMACEWSLHQTCAYHIKKITKGSGDKDTFCWNLKQGDEIKNDTSSKKQAHKLSFQKGAKFTTKKIGERLEQVFHSDSGLFCEEISFGGDYDDAEGSIFTYTNYTDMSGFPIYFNKINGQYMVRPLHDKQNLGDNDGANEEIKKGSINEYIIVETSSKLDMDSKPFLLQMISPITETEHGIRQHAASNPTNTGRCLKKSMQARPASSIYALWPIPNRTLDNATSWELGYTIKPLSSYLHTFLMTAEWVPGGYGGFQQTPDFKMAKSGKLAIFSFWNDRNYRVYVNDVNINDGIILENFGGKGTGQKAYIDFNWNLGDEILMKIKGTQTDKDSNAWEMRAYIKHGGPSHIQDLKSNGENKTITPDAADVLSKEAKTYMKEIEENNPGFKLIEGDMILNQQQQKTYGNKSSNADYEDDQDQALIAAQWPYNRMYYTFDKTVSRRFRKYIRNALAELKKKLVGCVKIMEGVGDNYITVSAKRNRQCVSMVGVNKFWRNTLNLDDTRCWHKGVIQHEFIHSLGIFHHQSRKDRDKYVKINWRNIITKPKDMTHNFRKKKNARTYNLPYDYRSIMHYGGAFFSKRRFGPNRLLTIETRNPKYQNVIGRQDHISNGDIRLIKTYYGCKKNTKAKKVSCGGHSANRCSECGPNKSYCNGDCKWVGIKCTKVDQWQPAIIEHGDNTELSTDWTHMATFSRTGEDPLSKGGFSVSIEDWQRGSGEKGYLHKRSAEFRDPYLVMNGKMIHLENPLFTVVKEGFDAFAAKYVIQKEIGPPGSGNVFMSTGTDNKT